jgi:hypothetical protein
VTTHLHLVLWSRMLKLYLYSPIRLHGLVLNRLTTGTTLTYLTFTLPLELIPWLLISRSPISAQNQTKTFQYVKTDASVARELAQRFVGRILENSKQPS